MSFRGNNSKRAGQNSNRPEITIVSGSARPLNSTTPFTVDATITNTQTTSTTNTSTSISNDSSRQPQSPSRPIPGSQRQGQWQYNCIVDDTHTPTGEEPPPSYSEVMQSDYQGEEEQQQQDDGRVGRSSVIASMQSVFGAFTSSRTNAAKSKVERSGITHAGSSFFISSSSDCNNNRDSSRTSSRSQQQERAAAQTSRSSLVQSRVSAFHEVPQTSSRGSRPGQPPPPVPGSGGEISAPQSQHGDVCTDDGVYEEVGTPNPPVPVRRDSLAPDTPDITITPLPPTRNDSLSNLPDSSSPDPLNPGTSQSLLNKIKFFQQPILSGDPKSSPPPVPASRPKNYVPPHLQVKSVNVAKKISKHLEKPKVVASEEHPSGDNGSTVKPNSSVTYKVNIGLGLGGDKQKPVPAKKPKPKPRPKSMYVTKAAAVRQDGGGSSTSQCRSEDDGNLYASGIIASNEMNQVVTDSCSGKAKVNFLDASKHITGQHVSSGKPVVSGEPVTSLAASEKAVSSLCKTEAAPVKPPRKSESAPGTSSHLPVPDIQIQTPTSSTGGPTIIRPVRAKQNTPSAPVIMRKKKKQGPPPPRPMSLPPQSYRESLRVRKTSSGVTPQRATGSSNTPATVAAGTPTVFDTDTSPVSSNTDSSPVAAGLDEVDSSSNSRMLPVSTSDASIGISDTNKEHSSSKPEGSAQSIITCRSVYPYVSGVEGDLTLPAAGQLITFIEYVDPAGEWIRGSVDGVVGICPANFVTFDEGGETSQLVELAYDLNVSPQVEAPANETTVKVVTALYDYNSGEPNDLTFQSGESIRVSRHISAEWLYGEVRDAGDGMTRAGMFPASFVTSSTSDSPSPTEPGSILEDRVTSSGHITTTDHWSIPEERTTASGAITVTALHDFTGLEDSGEITFKCGDVISDVTAVSGEWWTGTHATSGHSGLFPANHVTPHH